VLNRRGKCSSKKKRFSTKREGDEGRKEGRCVGWPWRKSSIKEVGIQKKRILQGSRRKETPLLSIKITRKGNKEREEEVKGRLEKDRQE